ncbi:Na+/H+ antiporter NhaA [Timonella senegalensis]|uniref:Na+/H+ antiporter NhaA n=1 Tax=Timonella senegalensis TaxID=1465825 RepID=UPI002FDE6AA1
MSTVTSKFRAIATNETLSGAILLFAALAAIVWANSPWQQAYHDLSDFTFGPEALHLNLSVASWAADGLLALFFFVVGVELKHELTVGSLSKPKEAAVPVFAAIGGMIVPAVLFAVLVVALGDPGALHGWAIPTATDIAFAVGVLALFGKGLPKALRLFLLTLAVVDDLLAIIVIAVFYTSDLSFLLLGASLAVVAVFAFVVRSRHAHWWILIPLALVAWGLMHASGVHATIAGVLLGLTVPSRVLFGEKHPRTKRFEHAVSPISSGIALPIFAFFAAGVTVSGSGSLGEVLSQPVFIAVFFGLVVGKVVGVLAATSLVVKFTPLRLPDAIGVRDLLPVGFLCGIGFTVALLVAELSYPDTEHTAAAKLAILIGSVAAAILGAVMLRWDARKARHQDMNQDGMTDVNVELM